MKLNFRFFLAIGVYAGALVITSAATPISAQQQLQRRYEPSRPTISPYLNLFRDRGENQFLPNYQAFVRPLQQQYYVNQMQQNLLQQQSQQIGQLESNVQTLERKQAEGSLVAPTGHGAWFNRPGTRSGFFNTSRYYSQSGTVGPAQRR